MHHPSPQLLLAYAEGTLPEPHAAIVHTHARHCGVCRPAIHAAVEGMAQALEALSPASVPDDIFKRTIQRLDQPVMQPSRPLILDWKNARTRWVAPGLRASRLIRQDNSSLYLLVGQPGVTIPQHTHRGLELTLVMRGAFEDGGTIFNVGDIAESEAGSSHRQTIVGQEDCQSLLAISGGRLHFASWPAKIWQWVARI